MATGAARDVTGAAVVHGGCCYGIGAACGQQDLEARPCQRVGQKHCEKGVIFR